MSGNVRDDEIRTVVACLPRAGAKCMSVGKISWSTRIARDRVVKILLCARAKGLVWHTEPQDAERRRWRMA